MVAAEGLFGTQVTFATIEEYGRMKEDSWRNSIAARSVTK